MISLNAFEAEISDSVDVFIGPMHRGSQKAALYVVLPSFSIKVGLTKGNLRLLKSYVSDWLGEPDGAGKKLNKG